MEKKKPKILLAEDEPDVSSAVESFLRKRNLDVLTTPSGLETIELIQEFKPDILFLDINLKDINGDEILEKVRRTNKDLKIIIVTGNLLTEDQFEILNKHNLSGFYEKPISLVGLEEIIKKELGEEYTLKRGTSPSSFRDNGDRHSLRSVMHDLRNKLYAIRTKCEGFILDYEENLLEGYSGEEIKKMAIDIIKEVINNTDKTIEEIKEIKES